MNASDNVNTLFTGTNCTAPVSVSLAVLATDAKLVNAGVPPAAATVTASLTVAFTQVLRNVILARAGKHHVKVFHPTNCVLFTCEGPVSKACEADVMPVVLKFDVTLQALLFVAH